MFDVVIIGSGPAGLTAGIYTSRADLSTLIIGGSKWGGQLMQTTLVENFPGFPEGIQGPDLMANMRKQAENMGAKIVEEDVTAIDISKRPFVVSTSPNNSPPTPSLSLREGDYVGKAIIVATGAEFNWLGLPSEQKLIGRGVSSCATCDAAFFRSKKVIVVGGGDAAMEEALVLAKFATEVVLVHRRDSFRASKIMVERVMNNPKIKVRFNTEISEVLGEQKVEGVVFKNGEKMAVDGIFVAIGHSPATKIFKDKILLDEKDYVKKIKRDGFNMMTSIDGVFTAGDVHDIRYKQAITAAGYGCEAALEVEKWLENQT